MQGVDGPDAEESGIPNNQEPLGKRKRTEDPDLGDKLRTNPEEGKIKVVSTAEGDMSSSADWYKGGRAGPTFVFGSASTQGNESFSKDRQVVVQDFRPLAKDGVNRSFAALYDGQHSPEAAQDAADRLHLILQREDALVAKNSDEMTWSSEQKEGEGAKAQTEETAMTAALIRAFRAVDEEVVGSLEAHKKRGKTGPLHGLSGLVLVQVGEVLYTANTAGKSEAILCKAGKAITITHQGNREHKEKVSDLVDNRLLDQHDKVVTIVPAISRHEVEGMEYTFVVLASAALAAALKPQQVVDTVNMALKAAVEGNKQAAADSAVQELEKEAAKNGAKGFTAVVALLCWD